MRARLPMTSPLWILFIFIFIFIATLARAENPSEGFQQEGPGSCSSMEVWDITSGMCIPLPMEGMEMRMLMLRGDAFGVFTTEQGPRGRRDFSAPDWFMADIGTSLGSRHYLNLDYMGTFEKWTFPKAGYPELLQIGETNAQGEAYIDAQHPHSSPVMGLTLSDTIALGGGKDYLKLFFAPRGESTDGPVAFMHRVTGEVNPDAPLGHHIGQDVGHISSTVIGASYRWGSSRFELSAFNGTSPYPSRVDLPLGTPNSFAGRIIQEFNPSLTAMASVAYVKDPEPDDPVISSVVRYSASLYTTESMGGDWKFDNTLIYGLITRYDHASALSSVAEEFLFSGDRPRIWGRLEVLQRTAGELAIPTPEDPDRGHWVGAITLGYTHAVAKWTGAELGLGGSVTKDFLPGSYIGAYGGNPWSGKVFLRLGGAGMWNL